MSARHGSKCVRGVSSILTTILHNGHYFTWKETEAWGLNNLPKVI